MIILDDHNQESEQLINLRETTLSGLNLVKRSLYKDIYDFGETLLIVANDQILNPNTSKIETVPRKGHFTTKQSAYWFEKLSDLCPSHYISSDIADFPEPCQAHREYLQGRSMLVKKMIPLPVKCIVRGYLTGTGWLEYRETGKIAGNSLPKGLVASQRLPAPICIPIIESSSVDSESKELKEYCRKFLSETLHGLALKLYFNAWKRARRAEVLLVSTVFRFGLYANRIHLIGECITPDSSRFSCLGSGRIGAPPYGAGQDMLFNHRNSVSGRDSDTQKKTANNIQNLYLKLAKNR